MTAARPRRSNGPNILLAPVGDGGAITKPADEALRRAQAIRRDLMTHRARHAVGGERAVAVGAALDGKVREHLAFAAVGVRLCARHRHVAGRALVLDRALLERVIDGFAPHRRLPVRVARRVRHHRGAPRDADRHVFAAGRHQAVVARHALGGGREERSPRAAGVHGGLGGRRGDMPRWHR